MKKQTHSIFAWKYWFYDFTKVTAAVPGLIAFRPKLIYENEAAKKKISGGAILIANHIGFFDPVYLLIGIWYRRQHFVCTKEFFEGKKAFFFRRFQCIPIDRDNFGLDKLNEIADHLKNDELVCMFPEGHINFDQGLAAFKSGMVLLSLRSGKPVIPVYIQKRTHWIHRLNLVIGEPVDIKKIYGERPTLSQIEQAAELLHQKETELAKLIQGGIK